MIRHFYHVYAAGSWQQPVQEHLAALGAAGWTAPVTVGMVGSPADRASARDILEQGLAGLGCQADWTEADAGFEDVTLTALHGWARTAPEDAVVLYAHTKGAYSRSPVNDIWRRDMTRQLVTGWRACLELLAGDVDVVGCHWLTPATHPPVRSPVFGGNFWWARCSYVATLPEPVLPENRHACEAWIGLRNPRVRDLRPGWPPGFDTPDVARMTAPGNSRMKKSMAPAWYSNDNGDDVFIPADTIRPDGHPEVVRLPGIFTDVDGSVA